MTTEEKSHPDADQTKNLTLDYQQTLQYLQMLTNIRFLPLTLLPGIAGVAVNVLINTTGSPESVLAVAIVGLCASAGIILYDMHNTALYDAAVRRARRIEKSLGLPPSTKGKPGGLYNERPERLEEAAQSPGGKWFRPLTMRQSLGVALVYGVVVGAWMHIIVHSALSWIFSKSHAVLATTPIISILTLVGVTVVFIWRVPQILERTRAESLDE